MIELLLEAERALAVGLLEQAERLYRQASELDPRNSIAVVGLARVALEHGDETAAHALARRALAIDPENAAAQRMVERLEEVMLFRGDEPPSATAEVPAAPEAPAPPPAPTTPPRRSLLDRLRRRR